jgi:Mrr N-terminal domain
LIDSEEPVSISSTAPRYDAFRPEDVAMPVPPFATFWLPLLRTVSDGKVWSPAVLVEVLAAEFRLSADDRAETIASGKTRVLDRVQWTITYLRQALDSGKSGDLGEG